MLQCANCRRVVSEAQSKLDALEGAQEIETKIGADNSTIWESELESHTWRTWSAAACQKDE